MTDLNAHFFETHYYFDDDSHSMDAFARNKCEKELLLVLMEISKELEIGDRIWFESHAKKQGSLKDFFEIITLDQRVAIASLLVSIATLVFTIRLSNYKLDKELKKLDIEYRRLEIRKLKKELGEIDDEILIADNQNLLERFYHVIIDNIEIRKHLSKFYEYLVNCKKVVRVGFSGYDKFENKIIGEEAVDRDDFAKFLVHDEEIIEIDKNAKIIIFSPNLVKGRHKWRGYYEKIQKVIDFSMNDQDFKKDVESGVITFKNGSTIYTELHTHIKIDVAGNEKRRVYSVDIVLSKFDDGEFNYMTYNQKNKKSNNKSLNFELDF